ncbi:MAG: hypothetical protein R2843_01970 [Thermomicrobiales bacterium]
MVDRARRPFRHHRAGSHPARRREPGDLLSALSRQGRVARTNEELVDEVYDSCAPILAGVDHFRADLVHPSVMQALYKIRERPALFARLIGPGGDSTFNRIFAERTEALSMQALAVQCADEPPGAVPQAVRARASTGMFLSICSMWLDHGCIEPVETIADWYWKLTRPVWFPE